MRRHFIERCDLLLHASPSVLFDMYQSMTGDQSAPPTATSKNVCARLRIALDLRDPDFIYDLSHFSQGWQEQYDAFYAAAQAFIEKESLAAAHL